MTHSEELRKREETLESVIKRMEFGNNLGWQELMRLLLVLAKTALEYCKSQERVARNKDMFNESLRKSLERDGVSVEEFQRKAKEKGIDDFLEQMLRRY